MSTKSSATSTPTVISTPNRERPAMGTTFAQPPSTRRIPSISMGGKTPGIAQEAATARRTDPVQRNTWLPLFKSSVMVPKGRRRSSNVTSSIRAWTFARKSSSEIMETLVIVEPKNRPRRRKFAAL